MKNTVLATKWRPKLFSDLIGQDPVVTALINSLDNKRLHHSYLFTGTRGVGKTTLARILAKCLNCEVNGVSSKPCGTCASCESIDIGQFVDLYEIDAASRTKVEDTRELLENVQYMPTQGRYKIYLIDEVHMLSTHSFNALLKTLEEPPEHVKFILATTDQQKIPSTILSRCLHFNLNRIPLGVIKNQLEKILKNEGINYEEDAINNITKIADGSMRDALSITEQCISHGDNKITYENICKILCLMPIENINKIIDMIIKEDIDSLMSFIDKMYYESVDFKNLLEEIISILHQTAIFKITKNITDNIYEDSIKNLSEKYSGEEIQNLYQVGVSNIKDLEYAPDFKSGFEMTIVRMLLFTSPIIGNNDSSNNEDKEENLSNNKIDQNIAIEKNESNKKISKENALNIEKNWDIIITRLEIDPITKNLAKNIIFSSKKDNNLNFLIKENLISVVTEKSKKKLQEALANYFGESICIDISSSEHDLPTLHKRNEEDYNNKILEANDLINNDEFVKTIKEKFSAKSVDNSVRINERTEGE
tara:strand:+ start:868 stop:2475 length:1608 start_codon:yes stop_codon:yes gene_type:complete